MLKVDTDALGDVAQRYGVSSIPNFALFRGGRLLRQRAGAIDARQLERWAVAPAEPNTSDDRGRYLHLERQLLGG